MNIDPDQSEGPSQKQDQDCSCIKVKPQDKKQAVVIIHGIGEQVPMDTLRGFVNAVWTTDADLICEKEKDGDTGVSPRERNPTWTKPDKRNRSFELRRITTEYDKNGKRTDFYEFYWAHLMHGTRLEQVTSWLVELFARPRSKVPANVRPAYDLVRLLIIATLFVVIGVNVWWQSLWVAAGSLLSLGVVAFVLGLLRGKIIGVLETRVGDVVRYVKATPLNVGRRQEIREHGVQLLETLIGVTPEKKQEFSDWAKTKDASKSRPKWATDYDRVVLVGHSLGSIVAYDLLKYLYARVNRLGIIGEPNQPAREELERRCRQALIKETDDTNERFEELSTSEFRTLQRAAFLEQREQGSPWIISDFVTLGSPLTHAEFLMAKDTRDMHAQQASRILPTCPPVLEWDRHTDKDHFSYRAPEIETEAHNKALEELKNTNKIHFRYPHHAAHFAFTRWTNLYSPSNGLLKGDIVSGPLADHFAMRDRTLVSEDQSDAEPQKRRFWKSAPQQEDPPAEERIVRGIRDIPVLGLESDMNEPPDAFTHVDYWEIDHEKRVPCKDAPHHIKELRGALDLLFNRVEPKEENPKARTPRHWWPAALAITLAMLANAVNADVLRGFGVNAWFSGFRYGWPLLLNALDLAAVALGFWIIGGVSWARQLEATGIVRPIRASLLFAAILFIPACAVLWTFGGLAETIETDALIFGGVVFPVFEEVIFRGLAIGILMLHFRWPFWVAALLPSLFFGAFHMWQGDALEESLTIAAITAFGSVWFGWIYWKWDFNLWPAIWLHIGLNSAWTIFALGDNALGGQLGNAVRLAVIAVSIALTIWGQGWLRHIAGEADAPESAPA